jgi:hypothetical protein
LYDPVKSFVATVIGVRFLAENISKLHHRQQRKRARYLEFAKGAEGLARYYKAAIAKGPPISAKAHKRLRLRIELYEADAQMMRKLAEPPVSMRVSRSDRSESRQRVAFMSAIGGYLNELCGRPLDDVIAFLTDIAFPGPEPTSLDQARSARRNTTRVGRSKLKRQRRKSSMLSVS